MTLPTPASPSVHKEVVERLRKRAETRNTLSQVDPADYETVGYYAAPDGILDTQAADLIDQLTRELDEALFRNVESETQDALQQIGEEFGIHGGEPRVDGVRRLLTEFRSRAEATESRIRELEADVKAGVDVVEAAAYLIDRLNAAYIGTVVRDLDEAWAHYTTILKAAAFPARSRLAKDGV